MLRNCNKLLPFWHISRSTCKNVRLKCDNKTQVGFVSEFSTSSVSLNEKWDILTAVCLERKPVIIQPLSKLQQEYKNHLTELEFENSLKSDHEVRHEREKAQLEKLKKGDDIEVHLKETAQDFIDASTEELNKFSKEIIKTDQKDDDKSLNRKLDKHLVLVVKQKIGEDSMYLLPQTIRQDGETLKQTANRILKQTCGKELKATIYGNAPFGFYKYKYPTSIRNTNKISGAKVFIYFARYEKGELPTQDVDYKWLDRKELHQIFPEDYARSISQMLISE